MREREEALVVVEPAVHRLQLGAQGVQSLEDRVQGLLVELPERGDSEVEEPRQQDGDQESLAREVDLLDEVRVADDAACEQAAEKEKRK